MKKLLWIIALVVLGACNEAVTLPVPPTPNPSPTPTPNPPPTPTPPLPPTPTGRTLYVSPSGNDSNDGLSETRAFRTLQRASNQTQPGDLVLVMNGEYTNSTYNSIILNIKRSGTANQWIVYRAYPGHRPKIKLEANWVGILLEGVSYVAIEGFDIEGNAANVSLEYARSQMNVLDNPVTAGSCLGIGPRYQQPDLRSHHIVVRNNRVLRCPGGGIYSVQADYLYIENNVVAENGFYSPLNKSGISTYQNWNSDSSTDFKIFIRGNIVYKNENRIPFYYSDPDPAKRVISDGNGIIVDDGRNTQNYGTNPGVPYRGRILVENNLIFDNGGRGVNIFYSDNVVVRNNTLYANARTPGICCDLSAYFSGNVGFYNNVVYARSDRAATAVFSVSNFVFSRNLYFAATNFPNRSSTDLVGDPLFINPSTDPASANFRLRAGSPALGKGQPEQCASTDLEGKPRANPCTLGAHE